MPSFNTLPGGAVNPALEDALTQDAYTLVNARLGYEGNGGKWRIAAFVRNAFNEEYFVAGDATPPPGYGGMPGVPRTYGIEFGLEF
ncbi:MAG: TonB-dependent receptor [Proteobacteria bacterium]|nr:TonB-dependent receptor [Pseudomonadota bacterium]